MKILNSHQAGGLGGRNACSTVSFSRLGGRTALFKYLSGGNAELGQNSTKSDLLCTVNYRVWIVIFVIDLQSIPAPLEGAIRLLIDLNNES
jgi:hypothetical protein